MNSNLKELDWTVINETYKELDPKKANLSQYIPKEEDKQELMKILKDFHKSWLVASKGRTEFDDISALDAFQFDLLTWNNYHPNNGQPLNRNLDWRDSATSPIARNRAEQLVTDLILKFPDPKIIARDTDNSASKEGALVMGDLFELVKYRSKWTYIKADLLNSLAYSPAGYAYVGFTHFFKKKKTKLGKGENGEPKWEYKLEIDEEKSGEKIMNLPFDQVFINNVYEKDIQNQPYIFWRKIISYDEFKHTYAEYENAKYVKPGTMTIYLANTNSFYEVTDREQGSNKVEVMLYWNKGEDCYHIICNGIKLTQFGNPNPRLDKQYPFAKVRSGFIRDDFAFGKSFCRLELPDARIYNRTRQMLSDGFALEIIRPLQYTGSEYVDPNIIRPGSQTPVLTGEFKPLLPQNNLMGGVKWLQLMQQQVEKDLASSSPQGKSETAYGDAMIEMKANKLLLNYLLPCADFMLQVSELVLSDICQYMTLLDIKNTTTANKSYLINDAKSSDGESGIKNRKIIFDAMMPKESTEEQALNHSLDILEAEGNEDVEIFKMNPDVIRNMKYDFIVDLNTFTPISEEIKAQMDNSTFNQLSVLAQSGIQIDVKELAKDLIMSHNDKTKRNPDKYFKKEEMQPQAGQPPQGQNMPQGGNQMQGATPNMM